MTCREFVAFLDEYLSGEMPESVRADFERHVAGCANCTAYLRTYREMIRLAKSVCVEPGVPVPAEAPEELVLAILDAYARNETD